MKNKDIIAEARRLGNCDRRQRAEGHSAKGTLSGEPWRQEASVLEHATSCKLERKAFTRRSAGGRARRGPKADGGVLRTVGDGEPLTMSQEVTWSEMCSKWSPCSPSVLPQRVPTSFGCRVSKGWAQTGYHWCPPAAPHPVLVKGVTPSQPLHPHSPSNQCEPPWAPISPLKQRLANSESLHGPSWKTKKASFLFLALASSCGI